MTTEPNAILAPMGSESDPLAEMERWNQMSWQERYEQIYADYCRALKALEKVRISARTARNAALDEAAKVARHEAECLNDCGFAEQRDCALRVAAAIEALKTKDQSDD